MPDRFGRPTMEDGLSFARSMMAIKSWKQEQNKLAEEQKSQQRVKRYLNMIAQGQKPDPKKDPDFDYADYLKASAQVAQKGFLDENIKKMRLENDMKELEQHQQDINQRIQTAQAAAQYGDIDKAYQILAPIYNYVPDGHEFVGFKPGTNNKMMIMKDPTGKKYEQPAPPFEEALAMAKGLSNRYIEVGLQARERFREKNLEMLQNPQIWQSEDGKTKAVYVLGLNPRTGQFVQSWKDPKTGKTIKGFDEETGKIVKSDIELYPPEYIEKKAGIETARTRAEASKKTAEANLKRANMALRQAQSKPAAGGGGSKNKDIQYINWLMDAYGVSKAKATDIFRKDKSLRERIQGFVKDAEQIDTMDPKESAKQTSELKKKWGLDDMKDIAKLSPDTKQKIINYLTDKFPPEKYKDGDQIDVEGFIFTLRNGKWTR